MLNSYIQQSMPTYQFVGFGSLTPRFKNNYIFAFGGRVDQKNIVDTIECYDISKNVW
jgi:hypothetical protein